MNQLEADGLLVEGTRADVVQNQLVVITGKRSGTKVTGLSDLGKAASLAIAGGSVPVGSYKIGRASCRERVSSCV